MSSASLPARPVIRLSAQTWMLLVLSGVTISLCMGLRQSMGLFQRPLAAELGLSASAFGLALAVQNIVWGATQPFVGALGDRYGARPVLIGCACLYALGLLITAHSGAEAGVVLGAGLLVGIGVAGTGFGVLMGVVARAVPESRRSQSLGAVAAAGSLGTMLIAPATQTLIGVGGWRATMLVMAVVAATMALLALPLRGAAVGAPAIETRGQTTAEALREALTHRGFLMMTAAFFACGFQLVFITTHLPAFLAMCGVAPGVGAMALGVIGLCNTIGTYAIGLMGARFSQRKLLALIYLLRTVAIAIYVSMPVSVTSTLIFAAAMGFLWLGVAPLVSGIIGRMFGLRHFSTLYGVVFFSHQLGSFSGALLGGLAFDLTGSYLAGWLALVAIGLLAFTLQWPMNDRPPARPSANVATA